MLTTDQAAKLLGISRKTVMKLLHAGVFTKVLKNPHAGRPEYLIRPEEVEAYKRGVLCPSTCHDAELTDNHDATCQALADRHGIRI